MRAYAYGLIATLATTLACTEPAPDDPYRQLASSSNTGGAATGGAPGTGGNTGGTVSGTGGDGGDGGAGGADCNALDHAGSVHTEIIVEEDPPTATGGTISDGTYAATAYVKYTGPGGGAGGSTNTWQETIVFNGNDIEAIVNAFGSGDVHQTASITSQSGTDLQITNSCPIATQRNYSYSATSSTLVLIDGGIVITYLKQ